MHSLNGTCAKQGLILALFLASSLSFAKDSASSEGAPAPTRDPRQLTVVVMDKDESVVHGIGNFVVRLGSERPGVEGLASFSGLPDTIEVPVFDFEDDTAPKIRDLLGSIDRNGNFKPSANINPIKLSNGQIIRPGFYYLPPREGKQQFRSDVAAEGDVLLPQIEQKLDGKEPFLLDGAAFLGLTFTDEFKDRIRGVILTMRGHQSAKMRDAIYHLRDRLGWGTVEWPDNAFVNLTHPDYVQFDKSKARYIEELVQDLGGRMMNDVSTPHFLVVVENDRGNLQSLEKKMRNIANRGMVRNPVIPILVNMVKDEVFDQPNGVDWDRSRLTTFGQTSRVSIFWPNEVERSDEFSRVFELALGLSPKAAKAKYNSYTNDYWCEGLLVRKSKGGKK